MSTFQAVFRKWSNFFYDWAISQKQNNNLKKKALYISWIVAISPLSKNYFSLTFFDRTYSIAIKEFPGKINVSF